MAEQTHNLEVCMERDENVNEVFIPTEWPTPHIINKEAVIRRLLEESYGITIDTLKPLIGYYDLNYHVTAKAIQSNPYIDDIPKEGIFLKISNLADSKRPELLHGVIKLMDHVRQKGIVCQETIKSIKGEDVIYQVIVRTFLPGDVLAKNQITPDMLYNLGSFVAKVTQGLQGFHEPYFDTYDHMWNLANCPKVSQILQVVEDPQRKQLCEDILHIFEKQVLALTNDFRCGQIHGDLNENNILVSSDESSSDPVPQICGLLDFYDTNKSYLVFELAICAAHVMIMAMEQTSNSKSGLVVEIPGHLLAGYKSVMELYPAERRALRASIAARMVVLLVSNQYSFRQDPDNMYLIAKIKPGWEALQTFWAADPSSLENKWDEIVLSYGSKLKRDVKRLLTTPRGGRGLPLRLKLLFSAELAAHEHPSLSACRGTSTSEDLNFFSSRKPNVSGDHRKPQSVKAELSRKESCNVQSALPPRHSADMVEGRGSIYSVLPTSCVFNNRARHKRLDIWMAHCDTSRSQNRPVFLS
ncbi:hypothetical protein RRG08_061901 [Elysia crispata]|uniref:Hydroxylysine kinase n=1 Tax=Elysia crispata TaxID=231223 RepID=A0AAE1CIN2_9GAST|nr:hypothetical protein RRG08_061901 [Elysia crispata]